MGSRTLSNNLGLPGGKAEVYGGGHARPPANPARKGKRITRPNYPAFPNKKPNNSADFSLGLMIAMHAKSDPAAGVTHLHQLHEFAARIAAAGFAVYEHHWDVTDSLDWIVVAGQPQQRFE